MLVQMLPLRMFQSFCGKLQNITDHYFLHQNSEKSENLEPENIKILAFILPEHASNEKDTKQIFLEYK